MSHSDESYAVSVSPMCVAIFMAEEGKKKQRDGGR